MIGVMRGVKEKVDCAGRGQDCEVARDWLGPERLDQRVGEAG